MIQETDRQRGAAPADRGTVMVIDDSPPVLSLLRDVLEGEGWRVLTHRERVPLPVVTRNPPDLIVLDVLFGAEAHGLDFLRRLRANPETAAIPVVLCSGAVDPIRKMDGKHLAGATGLVLKPFDIQTLIAEIERITELATDGANPRRTNDLDRW